MITRREGGRRGGTRNSIPLSDLEVSALQRLEELLAMVSEEDPHIGSDDIFHLSDASRARGDSLEEDIKRRGAGREGGRP